MFVLFWQAFEDYEFQHMIPPDSKTKYIISIINIILAALFTIEMVLRWIGFGITRYFTNAWTLIDFVVVLVSSSDVCLRNDSFIVIFIERFQLLVSQKNNVCVSMCVCVCACVCAWI